MRSVAFLVLAAAPLAAAAPPPSQTVPGARPVPYWASIAAGEARMRTGPGRIYPASWVYRRAGLPVQVLKVLPGWRKVRDPDGAEGWMIANLLSADRTVYVRTAGLVRAEGDTAAAARWRIAPGVSAAVEACSEGWCRIVAGGRAGWIEAANLWGVGANETVE